MAGRELYISDSELADFRSRFQRRGQTAVEPISAIYETLGLTAVRGDVGLQNYYLQLEKLRARPPHMYPNRAGRTLRWLGMGSDSEMITDG